MKTSDGKLLPSHGKLYCAWMEDNLRFGEGDRYGEPVWLMPHLRRFLYRLCEYYPSDDPDDGIWGKGRRYKVALLGLGKGGAKTPLSGWVGDAELLGPLAPAFPRILVAASSRDQANLVFGDMKMAVTGPDWSPSPMKSLVEPQDLQLLRKKMPGKAERVAANEGKNDGKRATAFIADELHEWAGRIGRNFIILSGAVGKAHRNSFTLAITTAGIRGSLNEDGEPEQVWERLYERGLAVANGLEVDDEFLFEWYEAPEHLDLHDPEQWEEGMRAANPGVDYGVPSWDYLRSRWKGAQRIPFFEFVRYHANRRTAALQRWLPIEDWDACKEKPEIPEDAEVYVGIDYGKKRDTTAVVVVHKDAEGLLHAVAKVFAPTKGRYVEREDVLDHIKKLSLTYDVREYLHDPRLFEETAERLEEEGYPMVAVPQTIEKKVRFAQALYDAVIQRRLRHGGDPVLREHADGSVAKAHHQGDTWTIERAKQGVPNDAIIALAMAVEVADMDEGEPGIELI